MKIAKVIPFFKKEISQTSLTIVQFHLYQFSKIVEQLFNERLQQFLNTNNILSNSQYGFRAHMSTVHAALELTEPIYNYIDSKQHCARVFTDLKKAFDTVNHKLLFDKLSIYRVREIATTWLEHYIMNRRQYVVVDNQASIIQLIKCGVPQGSVLGPLLFLADDTDIFSSNENGDVLQDTLNRELAKLFVWFSISKVLISIRKNKLYVVSKQTSRP